MAPGLILGTLQYMAPEQLEGKDVDTRADIFSFGAVLYEMVTGRKAFEGKSQATLISAILSAPQSSAIVTPPALDRVIRTCLEKNRDDRWTNMHDVRLQLQWISQEEMAPAVEQTAGINRRSPARWRRAVPWTIAAVLGVGWVLVLGRSAPWKSTPALGPQRLSVELAWTAHSPRPMCRSCFRRMAPCWRSWRGRAGRPRNCTFAVSTSSRRRPSAGRTEQAPRSSRPTRSGWHSSPTSKLKKVPVTGGAVVTLADAPRPSWRLVG